MKYQDETIVTALIQTGSVSGAAENLHLDPVTIKRRMLDPDFVDLYRQARNEMIKTAATAATMRMGAAFGVIEQIMQDAQNPPTVRLKAAQAIFDNSAVLLEAVRKIEKEELQSWP